MNWKYPEVFDLSDVNVWKNKFMRKETLTREWDLCLWEIAPNIYEIPLFTPEFCDKVVMNFSESRGEMIKIWDHLVELLPINLELVEIMRMSIAEYMIHALYHVWVIDAESLHKKTWTYGFHKFRKNQDLRVRHDGSFISMYVGLEDNIEGGELYFPKYDFELKPKQGHCYFYPGRLTHRYGIKLLKSTENHSLITYLS